MMKFRREVSQKLRILRYTDDCGDVVTTCCYFGIGRANEMPPPCSRSSGESCGLNPPLLFEPVQDRTIRTMIAMASVGQGLQHSDHVA